MILSHHDSVIAPLLAQIPTPTGTELMTWLGCFAFIAMLINQGLKVKGALLGEKRSTELSPQPLEVKTVSDLVKETDCKTRHTSLEAQIAELRTARIADTHEAGLSRKGIYEEIEGVRHEMGEMERRLNAADEARTLKLHERVNDILEAVGELRGKVQ